MGIIWVVYGFGSGWLVNGAKRSRVIPKGLDRRYHHDWGWEDKYLYDPVQYYKCYQANNFLHPQFNILCAPVPSDLNHSSSFV